MTSLGVLTLSDMDIEDMAYRMDCYNCIEIKADIERVAEKLNIKKPFSVRDAKEISDYMNMEDNRI
ncbi:hypothetical protein NEI03_02650 [Brachyspira pilosicoli]|uniref:hypothetical protein n=1 Tax=Brachyspira pilosicoli TaxID=52584 RepID=UPI0025438B04|nr:hypothetical protein [Brachyspira pilosicoli]WIH86330.1 hypothetical protein NEI03_02650 [Brachyspira pilosicoli]